MATRTINFYRKIVDKNKSERNAVELSNKEREALKRDGHPIPPRPGYVFTIIKTITISEEAYRYNSHLEGGSRILDKNWIYAICPLADMAS